MKKEKILQDATQNIMLNPWVPGYNPKAVISEFPISDCITSVYEVDYERGCYIRYLKYRENNESKGEIEE